MLVDLKAEWGRCMQMAGHEPRPDQWYAWTLELMRGEREPQKRDLKK